MKKFIFILLTVLLSCSGSLYKHKDVMEGTPSDKVPLMPMPVTNSESAYNRWLQKSVQNSRLLNSMENTDKWTLEGRGEMKITGDRFKDGTHSLRMQAQASYPDEVSPKDQRWYGTTGVRYAIDGEDWRQFNRISIWVYPDLPGWKVITARLYMYNDGTIKTPGGFYPGYQSAQSMKNREWNHIVWEFTDLPRDRITGFKFEVRRQGNEPAASNLLTFDIDQLELQKVDPDQYEGWNVAPGRISFSNTGYQTGTIKKAIASDLTASEFQIIDLETNQSVLKKQVQQEKTRLGDFQVMDFSEIRKPGSYAIEVGNKTTRSFKIDDDVWRETIWKAINFFYVERCGYEIPGIHGICHRDWTVVHNNKRIVINGGWHDAGDLSQGLTNTSEAVYAMFSLADRLKVQNGEDALYKRLIEEAKWGLDWVNKTSFGDGYRSTWATMGLWSNGIIGDNDDISVQAQNSPQENFQAAAAEAIAARVLKESDPDLAAYNVTSARNDFHFAVEGMSARGSSVESASIGVLAAIDLYLTTGEQQFKDESIRLGKTITDSQQQTVLPELQVPITGFFYTSPAKTRLQTYNHPGHEQAAITALAKLCLNFPGDPAWIKWYTAVLLHSEFFQKKMSEFTEPYRMLPNSIRKETEYLTASADTKEIIHQQILNGFKIGTDWYLRVYAIQPQGTFRGNYGTMLSQTKAISTAAQLRGSLDLAELAEDQLHWVVGRNPFAQSTMYGEGYDYQQQYSAMSGDIVGSLPVGIKSRENFDLPYWPGHNYPNYKEVWVHPVSRWIAIMADIAGPAIVEGQANTDVEFREIKNGSTIVVKTDPANGQFQSRIPEGSYIAKSGNTVRNLVLLPASKIKLDFRPEFTIDPQIQTTTNEAAATVTIDVKVSGKGIHHIHILTDNLSIKDPEKEINLDQNTSVIWQANITAKDAPWVAVVIIDGNYTTRHEVFGLLNQKH